MLNQKFKLPRDKVVIVVSAVRISYKRKIKTKNKKKMVDGFYQQKS